MRMSEARVPGSGSKEFRSAPETARDAGREAVVVSHGPFCLDGMAAAVCIGRFYGEARVTPFFTHPSEVDRAIAEIARVSGPPKDLWITDITWKETGTEKYFSDLTGKGWRVFWVDHHVIALEKDEATVRAMGLAGWVASDRYSAARLLYDYLVSAGDRLGSPPRDLLEFEEAVLLADDNDRWLHHRPGSRDLAMTVAALGGMVAYRELMKLGRGMTYTPKMSSALKKAVRELGDSVALANRTRVERILERPKVKIVAALCKGYTSEVAEALRQGMSDEPNGAVFLLYNLDDQRISLRRTPGCNLNLADLARRLGGGGHPAAAGFELPEAQNHLQDFLVDRLRSALDG